MLISCHIPKTAGTSFANALQEVFGERFHWDASHSAIQSEMYAKTRIPLERVPVEWLRQYKRPALPSNYCIHGHFPLRKFISLALNRRNIFTTWLREPLEWRISLYQYWKQCYPHPTDKFLNRMFDENWGLGKFCLDPTFDNYQSRYLAWFPRRRINFIGVTENYASDLDYLSRKILNRRLNLHQLNVSKKFKALSRENFGVEFLRCFEANNQLDYRNYRDAREASDARAMNCHSRRIDGDLGMLANLARSA